MTISISLIIFITLITSLSVLRQWLVYEISGTSLLLFGSTKPGVTTYSLIFLPGTIFHELSHWIVAEILQVKTGEITILPDWEVGESQSRRLGSVSTARSDPFRGFLIGVAPFITGILAQLFLGQLLQSGWNTLHWGYLALIIYGIIVVSNSMMISKEDRRTWPIIIILFLLIMIILYRLDYALTPSLSLLISSILIKLNLILGVTVGLNLVMIGGSYGLRRMAEIVTKKKIVHK